jgi:hypothetical protein
VTTGSWLGPRLWTALLRHALPVLGVLLLGWSALDFLLYLLLETWLFLTLRMGVEGALNRSFGRVPNTTTGALTQIAFLSAMSGVVMAIVLGLVALVVRQFAIGDADWRQFEQAAAWRTQGFRLALLLMVADQVWDAGRFAVRIAPLPAPDQADDLQLQRMVLRIVFLAAAGVAAGLTPAQGAGGRAVVIALAAAMVMLDAWPEEHPPPVPVDVPRVSASDAAAAGTRRSRRRRGRSRRG